MNAQSYFKLINNNINDNDILLKTIKYVLSNDELCLKNKKKSFFHNLGFIKLVLLNLNDNSQIRLHIWLQGIYNETPHTHPWNFKSRVLIGSIVDNVYSELTTTHKPFSKQACISSFKKNGYKFKNLEYTDLKQISSNKYQINSIYSHNYSDIHLTTDIEPNTITLCVTGKSLTNISYVYSNNKKISTNEGQSGLNLMEYKNYLYQVLDIIQLGNSCYDS
jgi:hypothetical protein